MRIFPTISCIFIQRFRVGGVESAINLLYTYQVLSVSQVEVIGGADKYQAVCRKCYGGLMVDKENSSPFRNETPQNALIGKLVDSGVPRKLFSSLHLWRRNKDLVHKLRNLIACVCVCVFGNGSRLQSKWGFIWNNNWIFNYLYVC